ncbi:choice-of-anchor Q domain-containing protein, partial [Ketobacter sp.]
APATASLYPCEDHDMRGRPRPVGAGCDIGAMERQ